MKLFKHNSESNNDYYDDLLEGKMPQPLDAKYLPEKWRRITDPEFFAEWMTVSASKIERNRDDYYPDVFFKKVDGLLRYTPISDMYVVLWPKNGMLGPQAMKIENEYNRKTVHLDFGLPVLMRIGHHMHTDGEYHIHGIFIDPRTGGHLMDYNNQRDGIDVLGNRSGNTAFPTSLEFVAPFIALEKGTMDMGKVEIHENVDVFAYRTSTKEDAVDLFAVMSYMSRIYNLIDESPLFTPILKEVQEILNINTDGMRIPGAYIGRFEQLLMEYSKEAQRLSVELNY